MESDHILIWQKKEGHKISFLAAKIGKNRNFEKLIVDSKNENSETRKKCREEASRLYPKLPVYYTDWDFGPIQKKDGVYGYTQRFMTSGTETFIKQAGWKEAHQAEAHREIAMKKNIRAL